MLTGFICRYAFETATHLEILGVPIDVAYSHSLKERDGGRTSTRPGDRSGSARMVRMIKVLKVSLVVFTVHFQPSPPHEHDDRVNDFNDDGGNRRGSGERSRRRPG